MNLVIAGDPNMGLPSDMVGGEGEYGNEEDPN